MMWFTLGILLASFGMVSALPPTPSPQIFYGNIEYSGDLSMDLSVYELTVELNGFQVRHESEIFPGNTYEVEVNLHSSYDGDELIFYVGGSEASPLLIFSSWGHTEQDLVINEMPSNPICGNDIKDVGEDCDGVDLGFGTCGIVMLLISGNEGYEGNLSCTSSCTYNTDECFAPYCGDGTCSDSEDCGSCIADCGACGGSSSGSSGGGSSSGGGPSRTFSQGDSGDDEEEDNVTVLENVSLDEGSSEFEDLLEEESKKGFFSFITGAVVGPGGKIGSIIGILILILIIVAIYSYVSKKKSEEDKVTPVAPVRIKSVKKKTVNRKKGVRRK